MFGLNRVDKKEIFKRGISAGITEIAYVLLVVLVMVSMDNFMKDSGGGPLAMISVLLLLVFSAAVSGFLVFGYPAIMALQKKYHQAVLTLLVTILTLFIGFLIVLLVIFLM